MNKEEYLNERGYNVRNILCYFSDYRNFKKMVKIDPSIAEIIIDIPTEEEIQDFINRSYDIIKEKK